MKSRTRKTSIVGMSLIIGLVTAADLMAWGYLGHAMVGRIALEKLDDTARQEVVDLLGSSETSAFDDPCSWPDVVRETPEWEWSSPLHYVNLPRSSSTYDRERDCADGLCVTEGVKKYANQLSDPNRDRQSRWQALAWLCHLVGDLHQPLHAGFADDRGANQVDITFNGEEWNLHAWWDTALIVDRIGPENRWPGPVDPGVTTEIGRAWNPAEADDWTSKSNQLVRQYSYPDAPDIDPAFADQAWKIVRMQIQLAGDRLALILNSILGEGKVDLSERESP